MFSHLWTALIGLIVGAVAKLLMPGKDPGGWIITMLLGLAGSFVASYLGRMVGWYREGQSAGFIMSVLWAILLLVLYRDRPNNQPNDGRPQETEHRHSFPLLVYSDPKARCKLLIGLHTYRAECASRKQQGGNSELVQEYIPLGERSATTVRVR